MFLFLLLAYAAWARGGTVACLQGPLPWLAAGVLLEVLISPVAGGEGPWYFCFRRDRWSRILHDPVFFLGACFLLFLLVQWGNAGRTLVFDWIHWKWVYSAPRVKWLPSAVNAADAREMLRWFFPAWAVVLAIRARLPAELDVFRFLRALTVNAGLLSCFGIAQYVSGTHSIFWSFPLDQHFFASFGYPNHAGAYFILMFAAACGLVLKGIFGRQRRIARPQLAAAVVAALLCLAGANLTLAVVPIFLAWGVAAAAMIYAGALAWKRLPPLKRVRAGVMLLAIACLAFLLLAVLYHASPERVTNGLWEFRAPHLMEKKYAERAFLLKPALAIWRDHPWFGVGGWGFRYFLGTYIPPEAWPRITLGYANVHNDLVQFLAEFGVVGTGLMVAIVAVLLSAIYGARVWRRPAAGMAMLGAALVLAYSLMDLPFRSPAVLFHWLAVLAAAPAFMIGSSHRGRQDS